MTERDSRPSLMGDPLMYPGLHFELFWVLVGTILGAKDLHKDLQQKQELKTTKL